MTKPTPCPLSSRILSASLLVLCLSAPPAGAAETAGDPIISGLAAFHQGDFVSAAAFGEQTGTAPGCKLAARSHLAEGDFRAPMSLRRSEFMMAEHDARCAINLDDSDPEGHLLLVLALGLIGREESSLQAHLDGFAQEARAHIDRALALAPDGPWAYALLGQWNLEIVFRGGLIAEGLYGASRRQGIDAYRKALALEPTNPLIAYQFAAQLAGLPGRDHRAEALALLTLALQVAPEDSFDHMVWARSERLKAILETENDREIRRFLSQPAGPSAWSQESLVKLR